MNLKYKMPRRNRITTAENIKQYNARLIANLAKNWAMLYKRISISPCIGASSYAVQQWYDYLSDALNDSALFYCDDGTLKATITSQMTFVALVRDELTYKLYCRAPDYFCG